MKLYKHDVNDYYLLDETTDNILASGNPEHVSDVLSGILSNVLIVSGMPVSQANEHANREIDLALEIMHKERMSVAVFGRHSFLFPEEQ